MKKIVYFLVPMKGIGENNLLDYGGTGNIKSPCHEKVRFGLNAALANEINPNDDVKVVLIQTVTGQEHQNKNSRDNIEAFKEEFTRITNVSFESLIIDGSFSETKEDMEKLYRKLLDTLEENAEIYADTTFGPRLNLMIMMSVLNFAEHFFNAEIKMILNVKVLFDNNNNPINGTQELFDVSPFYYLNNLTNVMQASDGETALKALDTFFNL